MSPNAALVSLDLIPDELRQAVFQDAQADAVRVDGFLTAIGVRGAAESPSRPPVRLPAYFLVGLAAALRLREWERAGLRVHCDAGLPSATEALHQAISLFGAAQPAAAKEQAMTQLSLRVLGVFINNIAWCGRALLQADVELGEADEDLLVDALAHFLWAHRHDSQGAGPTERGHT
jgi:hypothetical protein